MKKEMSKEESAYKSLLEICIPYLLEYAKEAKEERDKYRGTSDEPFYEGQIQSFHWAISLLRQKAEVLNISLEELGLDKINPDKDLI